MASKKSRKVHVTFGDSKRIMSYEKGTEVQELRSLFLSVFSDVLADDISPANVKFQVLDKTFEDYVDLGNDQHLGENALIKAITVGTKEKQEHNNCYADVGCSYIHPCHVSIPWYPILKSQHPPDIKLHTIKEDVNYRFWNPVSNGLMQKVGDKVTCSGGFDDSTDTMIQVKSVGNNEFNLVFKNGDGPKDRYLYITSKGEGQEVTVSLTPTDDSVFVPDYYWGQTMFQSKPNSNSKLYLGSDSNNDATLVPMKNAHYPNPQAFFVVNRA